MCVHSHYTCVYARADSYTLSHTESVGDEVCWVGYELGITKQKVLKILVSPML